MESDYMDTWAAEIVEPIDNLEDLSDLMVAMVKAAWDQSDYSQPVKDSLTECGFDVLNYAHYELEVEEDGEANEPA